MNNQPVQIILNTVPCEAGFKTCPGFLCYIYPFSFSTLTVLVLHPRRRRRRRASPFTLFCTEWHANDKTRHFPIEKLGSISARSWLILLSNISCTHTYITLWRTYRKKSGIIQKYGANQARILTGYAPRVPKSVTKQPPALGAEEQGGRDTRALEQQEKLESFVFRITCR